MRCRIVATPMTGQVDQHLQRRLSVL